jgi:hypothetical protein
LFAHYLCSISISLFPSTTLPSQFCANAFKSVFLFLLSLKIDGLITGEDGNHIFIILRCRQPLKKSIFNVVDKAERAVQSTGATNSPAYFFLPYKVRHCFMEWHAAIQKKLLGRKNAIHVLMNIIRNYTGFIRRKWF